MGSEIVRWCLYEEHYPSLCDFVGLANKDLCHWEFLVKKISGIVDYAIGQNSAHGRQSRRRKKLVIPASGDGQGLAARLVSKSR